MSHAYFRHRVAAAGVLVVALASMAACGSQSGAGALPTASGGAPAPASSAATSSPSATGTSAQAVQQALAAYRAAFADWAAVSAVADKADYQNPRLADHMSGQALQTVTGSVYVNTNVDQAVSKGAPLLHPSAGEAVPAGAPTQVVVNDCVDTTSWLLWTSDAKHLFNDVPGGHRKTQSLVTYTGGAWKVSQMYMQKVGTC